jgi:hypothetical protein
LIAVLIGLVWGKNLLRHRDKNLAQRIPSTQIETPATFVGGRVCASCHQEEYKLWSGSHHDLAMQEANEKTVLGDFNSREFNYFGIKSKFYKRDGRFIVRTDGPDGELHDYEIKYTFGVYPLQQYLIEFPGGRLQALGIAWDSRSKGEGGQRWFHLYPNEKITHNDTIHWTGPDQNWNYMCADCHSTNLKKNYDLKSDTYSTTWSEINVSCEVCHGPGSHHVEWARGSLNTLPLNRYSSPQGSGSENKDLDYSKGLVVRLDERKGVRWTTDPQTGRPKRSGPRTTNIEIETCAPCHSRRNVIWKDYVFGKPYMDTYLPQLLEEGMYYADGQILG